MICSCGKLYSTPAGKCRHLDLQTDTITGWIVNALGSFGSRRGLDYVPVSSEQRIDTLTLNTAESMTADGVVENRHSNGRADATQQLDGKSAWSTEAAKTLNSVDPTSVSGRKTFRQALPQVMATTAKNILLVGYGLTLGFPTIVIPSVMRQATNATSPVEHFQHDPLSLTKEQISWFSSINLICVPVGSLLSGVLTQPFGRKPSMIALNVPFIAAWMIFHYANSVPMLYAGLVLTGFSGGVLEAPVLTYVAEITQPHLRGMLSATASMCVILGVFLEFVLGNFVTWRTVALMNIVFPVAAVCALCCVPESPHWLIGKGRIAEAEKSLQWLRGWVQPPEVQIELAHLVKSLQSSYEQKRQKSNSWEPYLKRTFLRPYLIVSMMFFFGHLGGMTTLQTYAVSIFAELGTPIDKYVATMLLGLVELLGALICVVLVHWTGKRPLTMVSLTGSGLCFITVAIYADWYSANKYNDTYSWIPITFLVGAALLTHTCIRLLPWILIGEVYPPEVRGTASGASGSIGYIFGFLANKLYFVMVDGLTLAGTFGFYSIVSLVGALVTYLVLPETEGRTLLEIEEHFAGTRNIMKEKRKKKDPQRWAADNPALDNTESHL